MVRESPSPVKGVRFRSLSLRSSWVQIPSPAPFPLSFRPARAQAECGDWRTQDTDRMARGGLSNRAWRGPGAAGYARQLPAREPPTIRRTRDDACGATGAGIRIAGAAYGCKRIAMLFWIPTEKQPMQPKENYAIRVALQRCDIFLARNQRRGTAKYSGFPHATTRARRTRRNAAVVRGASHSILCVRNDARTVFLPRIRGAGRRYARARAAGRAAFCGRLLQHARLGAVPWRVRPLSTVRRLRAACRKTPLWRACDGWSVIRRPIHASCRSICLR